MLKVFLPLAIIGMVFVGLFAYLDSRGPFQVDCGSVDPTVCEEAWRELAAKDAGLSSLIPVTRVRVIADSPDEAPECLDIYIERLIFSTLVVTDCP